MACLHCHVDAGPARTEIMTAGVRERVIELIAANPQVEVVDLTGGAPELNPGFRDLVLRVRALGRRVIDRCNLTVLLEPEQEGLAGFLAEQHAEIVASLPCYLAENVERQRGRQAFPRSIEALRRLNDLGYGRPGSALRLDLVYNPVGAVLPPAQGSLEERYKEELSRRFGIDFHHLLTLTNMPVKRFGQALHRSGQMAGYMSLLTDSFNPETTDALMCRSMLSVGWDGRIYDCDFNQMLQLPLAGGERDIWDIDSTDDLAGTTIATADHCYGCTAGAGSSCSGALG
jgi:radical SAM/Cys-rich protein